MSDKHKTDIVDVGKKNKSSKEKVPKKLLNNESQSLSEDAGIYGLKTKSPDLNNNIIIECLKVFSSHKHC